MTLRRIEAHALLGERSTTQSKGEIYDEAVFEAVFVRGGCAHSTGCRLNEPSQSGPNAESTSKSLALSIR